MLSVRRHRRRRCRCPRHTFCFCLITWRDVLISFKFCRTLYHYKIQVQLDIGNHQPNFGWVMALFWLSFCCSFPLNNFWRDALISFKLCRTLYHCRIQVKFDIGNHRPNFGWVMALFRLSFCWCVGIGFWSITCRDALIILKVCRRIYHCKIQVKFDINNHPQKFGWAMAIFWLSFFCCVDIGFHSITFAGMHWFYWKFAEIYIIVKYRSSSILLIIRKILGKLRPFLSHLR